MLQNFAAHSQKMVSPRVYKSAYANNIAYDMIMKGECGQFAPDILECFALAKVDFFIALYHSGFHGKTGAVLPVCHKILQLTAERNILLLVRGQQAVKK